MSKDIELLHGDCFELIKDIPDNSVVVGNPARIISNNTERVINNRWKTYFYGY